MKGRGKKRLHETPAEFAEAAEARAFRESRRQGAIDWDEWEREQRREQIRNMKMPSHPKPNGKRRLLYHAQGHPVYEDVAEYRKRIWNRAHRRAHKTTVPPKG